MSLVFLGLLIYLLVNTTLGFSNNNTVCNLLKFDIQPFSIFHNPAKVVYLKDSQLLIQHNNWLKDIYQDIIAFKLNKDIVLGLSNLFIDNLERRESPTEENLSWFTACDTVFYIISKAPKILSKQTEYSFGYILKFIYQRIDTYKGVGFAFDVGWVSKLKGYLYPKEEDILIGFAISNIGPKMKIYKRKFPLPLGYRINISYDNKRNLVLGFDLSQYIDRKPKLYMQAEYKISILNLKIGYIYKTFEDWLKNFIIGFGINISRFSLNYIYLPLDITNNYAHIFSVKIRY
jgi:hypothetical protein